MTDVDSIRQHVGDDLRAVAVYHEHDYEVVYERADVGEKPRAIDRIHQELVMEGLGTRHLEDVFDVGKLDCTIHSFEEAMCFHFVRGSLRGVFVSIEPDALLPLGEFVSVCKESEIETSW
mgnify:CR=1 FL=1